MMADLDPQAQLVVYHARGLDAADLLALARWRNTHDPTVAEETEEYHRLLFARGLVEAGTLNEERD